MRRYGLLLALFLLTGCNHLFYHPDSYARRTPAEAALEFEEFTVTVEDGAVLWGWWIKPRTAPKGIVVHFHGNAQNMTAHVKYVDWLAERGFHVVTFDYRGYGASTGSPDREGLVKDGEAILAKAASLPVTPADLPLFVFGQSLGGAVAIPAVVNARPPRLKAVVVESTFSSYRAIARRKLGQVWLTWLFQWPASFLVSDDLSPVDYVARLETPLLVIHGTADDVVPMDASRKLFAAANAGKREYWETPEPGHARAFVDENGPWRDRLVRYFADRNRDAPGR